MNFKVTLWKTIVSIIVGFLADISLPQLKICKLINGSCPQVYWYSNIFDLYSIIVWILTTLIIYFIWSLFQKNKD
ncbi:MAG: hypothetical protein Q7S56_03975 [Nanoarchaeota archaeon]|nr:hypothetical protein [Nanoarchaeota archaeon]